MSQREIGIFEEEYFAHKIKGTRHNRTVTDKDLMILKEFRGGMLLGELAQKYKISRDSINTAIRIAAIHSLG